MTTVEDEHTLRTLVTADYPELPYFMYGHSWGSIIARIYAAKYSEGMAGLVICGALAEYRPMLGLLSKTLPYIQENKDNEVVPELMAAFKGANDRYEDVQGIFDWVAADEGVRFDHSTDPFNNLSTPMNVRLLHDLSEGLHAVQGVDWAKKIPLTMPIYNISGDMDPIGDFGEGTYMITRWLAEAGHRKVTTKVYSGYRHEIHNEPPIRDEVEAGIVQFIEDNI